MPALPSFQATAVADYVHDLELVLSSALEASSARRVDSA